MKINDIVERFCPVSLRASFPPGPYANLANITRRACLRLGDRWFYLRTAICVAFFAGGFLLAGIIVSHSFLVLLGLLGFALSVALVFRLAPGKLNDQTIQAEAEAERTVTDYANTCKSGAEAFVASAMDAIERESQSAMRDGGTLAEMAEYKEDAKDAFLTIQSECAAGLAARQAQSRAAQEEVQRKRGQLTAICGGWKAMFIPGPARRAAREVLNSISNCSAARLAEVTAKAEVQVYQAILQSLDTLPMIPTVESPASSLPAPAGPVWIGTPIPPTETLQRAARELVEANVKTIREKVVVNSEQQSPGETVTQEIEDLLETNLSGTQSVEQHVLSLNGGAKDWAERVLREAMPFSPITPHVGRIRHRKCWCVTAGAASSAVFLNLKDSLSDQSAKLFALENSSAQMLFFDEERGVTPGEFDELKGLFDAFRALPPAERRLLVTACNPEDLINFYPEFAFDENRPLRLLACSLVFGVIRRDGSETYTFESEIIGKGFGATLEAIKIDRRLAANVSGNLETTISSGGLAAATAKLKTAKEQALSHVPKAFVKPFQTGIDDALAELNRRPAGVP